LIAQQINMNKGNILLHLWLFFPILLTAQPFFIEGRVFDEDNGEGIPFSNVYIDGTSIGASTDIDGFYQLELTEIFDSISVSAIGYDFRKRPLSKSCQ